MGGQQRAASLQFRQVIGELCMRIGVHQPMPRVLGRRVAGWEVGPEVEKVRGGGVKETGKLYNELH